MSDLSDFVVVAGRGSGDTVAGNDPAATWGYPSSGVSRPFISEAIDGSMGVSKYSKQLQFDGGLTA